VIAEKERCVVFLSVVTMATTRAAFSSEPSFFLQWGFRMLSFVRSGATFWRGGYSGRKRIERFRERNNGERTRDLSSASNVLNSNDRRVEYSDRDVCRHCDNTGSRRNRRLVQR